MVTALSRNFSLVGVEIDDVGSEEIKSSLDGLGHGRNLIQGDWPF